MKETHKLIVGIVLIVIGFVFSLIACLDSIFSPAFFIFSIIATFASIAFLVNYYDNE